MGRTQRNVRVAALLSFWGLAVLTTCFVLGTERVPDGTTVNGVNIGGLESGPALEMLTAAMEPIVDRTLTIQVGDRTARVKPSELGLSFDATATVAAATTNRFNPFDLPRSWFGSGAAEAVVSVDSSRLNEQLSRIAAEFNQPMSEPEITYTGTTPVLHDGVVGSRVDEAAAAELIVEQFLVGDGTVELPTIEVPPTVSAEQAQQALSGPATTATSAPLIVSARGVRATATPDDIAAALTFRVSDGQLKPVVDGAELRTRLAAQLASVDKPAKDASWDVSSGKPVVVPARNGDGVTDENLATAVVSAVDKTGDERVVELQMGPLEPKLSTEAAQQLGINEKLSSFTQKFDYAAYRVQNIGQAGKKINKTLLAPGEIFSFNEVVGERTKANGFTEGPVVGEGGVLRDDMGGGVSAAATTTWTAAFYAGLERVEQGAHLIWISRYRPGLEATVAWGQLDLKFRNNTPASVLITTKMTNTSLTVTMWGTKQYDQIKAVSGPKRNIVKYELEKRPIGPDCGYQAGVDGFDITVERVFFKGGQEVHREPFTTHYIPAPQIQCVAEAKRSVGA